MKKLFTILVMLVAVNASGQWLQMSNWNGSGKQITCIASDSNYLFVGTNIDGLYRSTNNGETFVKTSLNVYIVYSIALSGNNVFAGTQTGLCRSTDKGSTWSLNSFNYITIPKIFIQGNYVYVSTDSLYAFKVFFSSNNGTNWIKTNFNSQRITSFTYYGNYLYAASKDFGSNNYRPPIFRSALGDTSWTVISIVDSIGDRHSVGALAPLGNYIFAGMRTFQGYMLSSVYRSSNNGLCWVPTILDEGNTNDLTTIDNNLVAATESGIFISTNYGTNWIIKNQGFGYTYYDIDYLSKNNNYIFGGRGIQLQAIWRRSLSEIIGIQNISTETPAKYSLSQNYPNPFNSMCNVQFSMYNEGNVKLVVYDIIGREVQTLVNERLQPGMYEAAFDGSMLNSGVYFYRMVADSYTETKKMLLIK